MREERTNGPSRCHWRPMREMLLMPPGSVIPADLELRSGLTTEMLPERRKT